MFAETAVASGSQGGPETSVLGYHVDDFDLLWWPRFREFEAGFISLAFELNTSHREETDAPYAGMFSRAIITSIRTSKLTKMCPHSAIPASKSLQIE